MAVAPTNSSFYADPAALSGLKRDAAKQSPDAMREAAKQFESLFTNMMLKSMRSASMKDPIFGSDQADQYQDMYDQQLATQLSKGKGLGLADMLMRQLMGAGADPASAADGASSTSKQLGLPVAKPASAGIALGVAGASATGISTTNVGNAGAGTTSTSTSDASTSGANTTSANWPPQTREDFVNAIRPAATAAANELGVDPDTLIAHAALETGWGQSMPTDSDGRSSQNLFGIKAGASWQGATTTSTTHEFGNGRMQTVSASFRAYDSPEQSMRDYVSVLKNSPRYAAALGTGSDVAAFARGLAGGGYATDPDYVAKLSAVAARLKGGNSLPINNTTAS